MKPDVIHVIHWSKRGKWVYVRMLHPDTGESVGLFLKDTGGRSAATLGAIKLMELVWPRNRHEAVAVGNGMKQGIFRVFKREGLRP